MEVVDVSGTEIGLYKPHCQTENLAKARVDHQPGHCYVNMYVTLKGLCLDVYDYSDGLGDILDVTI